MTRFPDLFVSNYSTKRNKKRKSKSILSVDSINDGEEDAIRDDARRWHKPSKTIVAHDQSGLVIVVQDCKGLPLSSTAAAETPSPLQDTLNCPSIKSVNDMSSPLQTFFPILSYEYEALCSMYSDGMSVSDNYEEDIDKELGYFCTETFSLVSTDKLPPPNNFYGFTRIFAGDGSPDVDSSFTSIQVN